MAGKPSSGTPPPLTTPTSTPYRVRHRRRFSGPFTCGQTLAVCAKNLLPLLVLTCVVFTPVIAFQFYSHAQLQDELEDSRRDWHERDDAHEQYAIRASAAEVLKRAFMFILQGLVAYLVFRQLQGRRARIADSVSKGLGRLPQVLAVSISPMIAVCSLAVLPAWLEGLLGLNFIRLILFVPAYIAYMLLFVCVQATVVEGTGVIDSLRRSVALTRGRRWSIFGGWFLLLLVQVALGAGILFFGAAGESPTTWKFSDEHLIRRTAIMIIIGMTDAVYASVVYHNLRYDKEGAAVEEIGNVFA